jgi:hypothetical protein
MSTETEDQLARACERLREELKKRDEECVKLRAENARFREAMTPQHPRIGMDQALKAAGSLMFTVRQLEAQLVRMSKALLGLQCNVDCWCGRDQTHPWADIHPGFQVHSPSCEQARAAMSKGAP